jgi:hypothetical protein
MLSPTLARSGSKLFLGGQIFAPWQKQNLENEKKREKIVICKDFFFDIFQK